MTVMHTVQAATQVCPSTTNMYRIQLGVGVQVLGKKKMSHTRRIAVNLFGVSTSLKEFPR
jgi:hypothetical protein